MMHRELDSTIREITYEESQRITRRLDRFLSLLNEDEALILANSKIAARVEVSEAQWTKEKLIDMIFQSLAEVSIIIEYKGETYQIPKYSERIVDLAPKLAVFKPTPTITINLSDIHPEILAKLYDFDKKQQEILLEVGKRLFNTFYPYYFNMVANLVKVRIEP
ncbi:MAG: hypothetical protein WA941_16515 [Nitrososphaeraceae archaeon]